MQLEGIKNFFNKLKNAIISICNSINHYISSLKSKINKQITVTHKHNDIKVVKVKIKKVTVKKQNKNETN